MLSLPLCMIIYSLLIDVATPSPLTPPVRISTRRNEKNKASYIPDETQLKIKQKKKEYVCAYECVFSGRAREGADQHRTDKRGQLKLNDTVWVKQNNYGCVVCV